MAKFRHATLDDALLLYVWRCRAEQAPWYEGESTIWEEHRDWFVARLIDPLVQILIWETTTSALGVVRIDSNGELSYYVENSADAVDMLRAATRYAHSYGGRLKVTIDADDVEALEAFNAAGFETYPAHSLVYTT